MLLMIVSCLQIYAVSITIRIVVSVSRSFPVQLSKVVFLANDYTLIFSAAWFFAPCDNLGI